MEFNEVSLNLLLFDRAYTNASYTTVKNSLWVYTVQVIVASMQIEILFKAERWI